MKEDPFQSFPYDMKKVSKQQLWAHSTRAPAGNHPRMAGVNDRSTAADVSHHIYLNTFPFCWKSVKALVKNNSLG